MAMSLLWTGMVTLSLLFGGLTGRLDAVSAAALEGAQSAVTLCLSMAGILCLWSGVMELLRQCGLAERLSRAFRPLLRRLLPRASQDPETLSAVSANVSANLLGLGNAATCGGTASDELCRLVVLNTASIQLIPSTVAGIRAAAGAAAPFDLLPAVWVSSCLSVAAGLFSAAVLGRLSRGSA